MMHGSKYVIDTSNLKKMLAAKFLNSSTMKIRKLLGYKTQWHKDAVASFLENKALGHFSTCVTAFKIILIYV